ncbi:MAG: DUF2996 domain-containing protein [Leptolyngbyaceae cyanobacterium bins.349]|nr:DUF2996 domain-containing protein [Leptolyngbyaceae cyanobacterium bins.349]
MPEETTPDTAPQEATEAKPAKAKKEKGAAVEDKPFANFIQEDLIPALKTGLEGQGVSGAELTFAQQAIAVKGFSQYPPCAQVVGRWNSGYKQPRQFNLYFFDDNINGKKGFSCSESDSPASTLESFRIDERKSDLGLLVFWTLQRLNAQKWLVRN